MKSSIKLLRVFTRVSAGILITAIAALFALGFAAPTFAQTAARPDRGVRPTGSYAISDIEKINMNNGNLNISIPLASLPPIAGGRLSWTIGANYNSKTFDMYRYEDEDNSHIPPIRFITSHLQLASVNAWMIAERYRIDITESHSDTDWRDPIGNAADCLDSSDPDCLLMQQHPFWYKVTLTTPDGTTHELRPSDGGGDYPNTTREYLYRYSWKTPSPGFPMPYYSYDGSYLWASIESTTFWDVYMPDGTRIKNRGARQWIIDTNGNQVFTKGETIGTVSTTFFRDEQTGREIRYVFDSSINQPWGQGRVEYQTVGGGWASVVINFRSTFISGWAYNVGDPNCDRAELVTGIAAVAEITVVDSIVLPQSEPGVTRQFSFAYNSDSSVAANYLWRPICGAAQEQITSMSKGLGSLSQITMPSGAMVKYSYQNDLPAAGPITAPLNPSDFPGEALIKREFVHDGTTDVWNYALGQSGISSMAGPDGSLVIETSYPHDRSLQYSLGGLDGKGGLTYRTAQKNSAGSDLVVTERKWKLNSLNGMAAGATGSSNLTPFNPLVDIEFTTLMDPPGTPSKMSAKQFQYDLNGNLISETDYDWFSPSLVSRDAQGVPTAVPASAAVLRVTTNSYYNDSTSQASPNIYHKRVDGLPLILNAPRTSVTGPSQAEFYYDGNLDLNTPPPKGNLTTERHWEGTKWIQTTHTYDAITGNRTSTTDPKGNVTQFFYDATQALPSSVVVDPLNGTGSQTTSTVYDFSTGLPTSVTDPNGRTTSTSYVNQLLGAVDPFNRPGVVTDPQGRRTVTRYFDSARQLEVWSDLNAPFDAKLRTRTSADQLGRPIKTESSEDGVSYSIFADTVYQQMGKITITTNPMRAGAAGTDGWTRTTRDDIGRVVTVETFSGRYPSGTSTGTVSTTYNANATTVTDQAGKVRRSIVDGLGRLVRVDEPDSSGNLGLVTSPVQPTSYSYDSRGNLTQVVQGSQTRSFVYDGLSRLKQATNPESGTINYAYDDNSNLLTKTDARSVVTAYAYDGLNRVTSRTYSGPAPGGTTPAVSYVYDTLGAALNGKGRLTSVSSSVSSYSYGSYDVMGRPLTGTQTTDGNSYTMSYGYNLAGGMTSETYPSGRVITTGYDSAGRVSAVNGQNTGEANKTYASQFTYSAHGAVAAMALGNGLWEHTNFNSRLQPLQIGLGSSSGDSSILQLDYGYGSTNNNGNVQSQTITIGSTVMSQSYGYDSLNRLSSASETGGWSQTYGYDRFGNRRVSASTGYTLSSLTPTAGNQFSSSNNRIVIAGFSYDAAGNLTADSQGRTFAYDGENRQISFNGTAGQYFYDSDGHRVKKIDSSGTTVFVYDVTGRMIAEYHSDPVPPASGGGGTSYLTSDHLGSTRVVTKSDGSVKARYDYLPFGEELGSSIGSRTVAMGYSAADSTKQKFTQKERDNESGLDYFLARYYSSAQGRFTSPDEFAGGPHEFWVLGSGDTEKQALPYADTTNPQSVNKYQYCLDNPLRYVDPDGHQDAADLNMQRDDRDYLAGRITEQEYIARRNARAAGAAVGVAVVGTAIFGPRVGIAILSWMARNPDKVQQAAEDLTQASTGSPAPATRLSPAAIGEEIGQAVRGIGKGQMTTIAAKVTERGLNQADAVSAVQTAIKTVGKGAIPVAQADGSVVVASVRVGANQPVLIVNQGGQVVRGTATISAGIRNSKPFFEVKNVKPLN